VARYSRLLQELCGRRELYCRQPGGQQKQHAADYKTVHPNLHFCKKPCLPLIGDFLLKTMT